VIVVLDASAVVDLLIRSDPGEAVRRFLASHTELSLVTVSHLDAEVMSALARLWRAGILTAQEVTTLLARQDSLSMQRLPITSDLLAAAWALRDNIAARDALYVAAARGLGANLVSTDDRLVRAIPDLAVDLA
jgi:predicted nucleic acid-binding protein